MCRKVSCQRLQVFFRRRWHGNHSNLVFCVSQSRVQADLCTIKAKILLFLLCSTLTQLPPVAEHRWKHAARPVSVLQHLSGTMPVMAQDIEPGRCFRKAIFVPDKDLFEEVQ